MNNSLKQKFPTHRVASPPTSGGFYRFPKPLYDSSSETKLGDDFPAPQKPLRLKSLERNLLAAEQSSVPRAKTPSRTAFKYVHRMELLESRPESVIPLKASFSHHSCFLGVDNRSSVDTQTVKFRTLKKEFEDFKEYRAWGTETVDSFVKELRKQLMAQKPSNIENFCIAFCKARMTGEPAPETIPSSLDSSLSLASIVPLKAVNNIPAIREEIRSGSVVSKEVGKKSTV